MTHKIEVEQSIIGAVLIDGTLFDTLKLEATHFGNSEHQIIFNAMNEINKKDKLIDIITLSDELGKTMDQVGGLDYLTGIINSITTHESIKFHEGIVLEAYQDRMFKKIAAENLSNSSHENIDETIKKLEDLRNVISNDEESTYQEHLKDLAYEIGSIKDLSKMGYQTGFREYDKLTGGLQNSDLIVVGARASIGKTAFGLNVGVQHCESGGTTHIFSMEMPTKDLIKRLINMTGKIESSAWHNSEFSTSDYEKGINAIGIMSEWSMNIYSNVKSVSGVKAVMRKVMQESPDERHLVIIDHLGEFEKRSGFDRNDLEVGDNAKQCRDMAKEHDIPVVLLTQINRGVEQRQDKRPMMSDLRDSGQIEQLADVVALLYRDDYYANDDEEQTNVIEILIRKQRDGPQGDIELGFIKEYGQFTNLDFKKKEEST